jgi:hypothetical protein
LPEVILLTSYLLCLALQGPGGDRLRAAVEAFAKEVLGRASPHPGASGVLPKLLMACLSEPSREGAQAEDLGLAISTGEVLASVVSGGSLADHLSGGAAVATLRALLVLVSACDAGALGQGMMPRLAPVLLSRYGASLSEADQLTLRLLRLVGERAGEGLPLAACWRWGTPAGEIEAAMTAEPERNGADVMVERVDMEMVYQTLASFSLQRPLSPLPCAWEVVGDGGPTAKEEEEGEDAVPGLTGPGGDDDESEGDDEEEVQAEDEGEDLGDERAVAMEEADQRDVGGKDAEMDVADDDASEGAEAPASEGGYDGALAEDDDDDDGAAAPAFDPRVLDPAFILPLLDGALRTRRASVRTLTEGGLVMVALMGLASRRRSVRLGAFSCLQLARDLLAETPKTDVGKRCHCCDWTETTFLTSQLELIASWVED